MIRYKERTLSNGLRVIVGRDTSSKLAAVNVLYEVGARNEDPSLTGFAHLFEHLMFRGTERFENYDEEVQLCSGENNAFTNNDYTDYYLTVPKVNLSRALALEADRMRGLILDEEVVETEKLVVIEEFKQRYLNQPYGDMMMMLRDMCYKVHPYRWSTIGLSPEHVASATLEQARAFYDRYYSPSSAILSVVADYPEEQLFEMCEEAFGGIEASIPLRDTLPCEPPQLEARRTEVEREVPATYVLIAFHIDRRASRDFFTADLVSDLLAGGDSGRLYQRLVKGEQLFATVNAYVTGEIDPGLFVFTAQLLPETTVEQAEAALWREIELLKTEDAGTYELTKVKNKFEANTLFGEINVMNKAMNMGFYKMLGDMPLINREVDEYRQIDEARIRDFSQRIFCPSKSNTLIYKKLQ